MNQVDFVNLAILLVARLVAKVKADDPQGWATHGYTDLQLLKLFNGELVSGRAELDAFFAEGGK